MLSPPVQWRGGQLTPLFKGSGDPQLQTNYGDVTLADVCGKVFGCEIRMEAIVVLKQFCCTTKYGSGLNNGCTDYEHFFLKSIFEVRSQRSKRS